MVYVFDPTKCDEPKKPTYRYSPIPKVKKPSCCCEEPVKEEEKQPVANTAPVNNNAVNAPQVAEMGE